jgi:hypothetical protein
MFLHAFNHVSAQDSAAYQIKQLHIDEINLVSSYYTQTGDHSSIQGGIGSENVTDLSNGLELKMIGIDAHNRKNTITAGMGIDYHTAASQAWVSKTGASKVTGTRVYPSINWLLENDAKKRSFGAGVYYSGEYNYQSLGADISMSKKTNNNGEFTAKAQVYLDQVKMIYPSEFIPASTIITGASGKDGHKNIPSKPRDTYDASFSFSQVINKRMDGIIMFDAVAQSGYLGLPFHRVYLNNGKDTIENLPSTRFKLPVGVRLNYFLGDKIILKGYYRYYTDSWGINSNTASIEVPYKITPFVSVAPFYRYYEQSAAKYFAAYEQHSTTDEYYTSNYSLSGFSSSFFGINIRFAPPKGVFKSKMTALEIRYGHYTQTTDLVSDVISVSMKFK